MWPYAVMEFVFKFKRTQMLTVLSNKGGASIRSAYMNTAITVDTPTIAVNKGLGAYHSARSSDKNRGDNGRARAIETAV